MITVLLLLTGMCMVVYSIYDLVGKEESGLITVLHSGIWLYPGSRM